MYTPSKKMKGVDGSAVGMTQKNDYIIVEFKDEGILCNKELMKKMTGFFNQILTDDGFLEGAGNFISENSVQHGLQPIFASPKEPGVIQLIACKPDFSSLAVKYLLERIQNPQAAPKDALFDPVVMMDVVQLISAFGVYINWKDIEPAGSKLNFNSLHVFHILQRCEILLKMCPEFKKDWDRYKNRALKSVKTGEEVRLAMLHASSAGIDVMCYLPKIKFPDQTTAAASNNLTAVNKMAQGEAAWQQVKNEFVSQEGTPKKPTAKKPPGAKVVEKKVAAKEIAAKKKEAAAKKKEAAAKKNAAGGAALNINPGSTAAANRNIQEDRDDGDHAETLLYRFGQFQSQEQKNNSGPMVQIYYPY